MNIKIIQDRLDSYHCQSVQEEENALREITQEIALAALSRTNFYKDAAFQGGTCLRVMYGVSRFSEDLDFILKNSNRNFSFSAYLNSLRQEFNAYGYQIEVVDRSSAEDIVKKAFLKDDSLGKVLQLGYMKADKSMCKIKIRVEIDTNPPQGSMFENKFLDFPFVYSVTVQDLPSLFAGKLHALLCREYTKGRDWYDFLWYVGRGVKINYAFLASALFQTGPWQNQTLEISMTWCIENLCQKIQTLNWEEVKADIARFIKPHERASIEVWGKELFLDRLENYQCKINTNT